MSDPSEICRRIAQVRFEVAGPRGKAEFARRLGLSPSTYDYYESSRVPPADALLRIAELGNVDLHWLLTGKARAAPGATPDHPVLRRAAAMLARRPEAAEALAAFLDILESSLQFPAKAAAAGQQAAPPLQPAGPEQARRGWIPVLGRSAAGIPQFWSAGQRPQETRWEQVIARHAMSVQPAQALAPEDGAHQQPAEIITLSEPDSRDVVEYVCAASVKSRYPDAFAVRIDGDSMSPDVCHGDLVILSPSEPAADGRAAVVQLAGQIGVTCKLYRRSGDAVHLVPVNEQLAPQRFAAGQVVWALRVLAKVKPDRPHVSSGTSPT